jgi:hypothetical protein
MYLGVVLYNIFYIYVIVLSKVVAVIPFLGNGDSGRMANTPHYNTLQSYTNISNTAVGNTIYN